MLNINAFKGHLRVRSPMFRDEPVLREIHSVVKMIPGVLNIEAKVKTGSILIKYDPSVLPMQLKPVIDAMIPEIKILYRKYSDRDYEVYRPYVSKIRKLMEKL